MKNHFSILILFISLSLNAQDTRLISEHVKNALKMISQESYDYDSAIYAGDYDFVKCETSSKGSDFKLYLKGGEVAKVSWVEFDSDFEVYLYALGNIKYGFISINGNRVSKGLIVRSEVDELFYLKLTNGFLDWLDRDSISHEEIINDIQSIYFLNENLHPRNTASFNKGVISKLKLDEVYYEFDKECGEDSLNINDIGFDLLGLLLTDIECGWIVESGTEERFKDWLAYYQFDKHKLD
ncbi:hypothetical protein [Ekhidna sp.]|uniref:hypothetical protein n=1 Tax=Ekhidna sp. TaxID=2608089 RepID=UPI003B59231E